MKRFRDTGLSVFFLFWALHVSAQCSVSASLGTKPACPGLDNGEILVQMKDGIPPFRVYLNGSTIPVFTSGTVQYAFSVTGLKTGTHSVRILDAKNCSFQNTALNIGASNVPIVTVGVSGAVCAGKTFTVQAKLDKEYSTSYSYLWSNGKTGTSFSDAISATTRYAVTVTDANGCKATDDASFSPAPSPSLTMPGTTQICKGETVYLTPTVTGGNAPYTYNWDNKYTTAVLQITPPSTSTYMLTVTDAKGCTAEGRTIVETNKTLSVGLGSDFSLCKDQSTSLSPTVGPSAGGLAYTWSTGAKTASISVAGDVARTYSVTITDKVGCIGSAAVNAQVRALPVINLPGQTPDCQGNTVQLNPALDPVKGPYTYRWSTGATSATLSISISTDQTIGLTVTDAYKCVGISSTSLIALPNPSVSLPTSSTACSNQALSLTAKPSGGTPGYTYAWNTGTSGATLSKTYPKSETVSVTVTDARGCKGSTAGFVNVSYPPSIALPTQYETCPGQSLTLNPSVSGGTGGYSYRWNTGSTSASLSVAPTAATTFKLTVTDANACSEEVSTTVVPSKSLTVALPTLNAACEGQAFTLTPTVSGHTGVLEYTWGGGQKTPSLALTATTSSSFSVTVKDQNGCTGSATTSLTVNPLPTINLPDASSACPGAPVVLNPIPQPSSGSFTYRWSTGATSPTLSLTLSSNQTIRLTVTDANGCSQQKSVSLSLLATPTVSMPTSASTCANSNLVLNANASGGKPGYTFAWSTGASGPSLTRTYANDQTVSVTVTDANGCSGAAAAFVSVKIPPTISLPALFETCPGQPVTLNPVVSGGGSSYQYLWSNGSNAPSIQVAVSTASTFQLSVTDGNNCSAQGTTTVNPSKTLAVALPLQPAACEGQSVTLTPTVSGSTGTLTFLWGDGQTAPSLALSATTSRTFSVTVKDQNGCAGSATTALTVHALPTIVLPEQNPACPGVPVALNPILSPDKAPYSYVWSNGQTSPGITLMPTGPTTVNLRVTDKNGCTQQKTVSVQTVPKPSLEPLPDTVKTCSNTALALSASASGGTPAYTFTWGNGSSGATLNSVFPQSGRLSLIVTDRNGCSDSTRTFVRVNPAPLIALAALFETCPGQPLTLNPVVSGGGGSYRYAWSNGSNAPSIQVAVSTASTFQLSVTDGNNCSAQGTTTVNPSKTLAVALPLQPAACEGQSVTLTPTVSGSTGTLTFLWSDGQTAPSLALSATTSRTFSVTVKDQNGCAGSATTALTVHALPTIVLPEQNPACPGVPVALNPTLSPDKAPYSYVWSTGQTSPGITLMPTGPTTVNLRVTDKNGCTQQKTVSVQTVPKPSLEPLPDTVRTCPNTALALSASASGGTPAYTFTWGNGSTGAALNSVFPQSGRLGLIVTDRNGCSDSTRTFIRVNPAPLIALAPLFETCPGQPLTLNPAVSGGGGSYQYLWSNGSNAPSIQVAVSTASTFQLSVTDGNNCSAQGATTVNPSKTLAVALPLQPAACEGQSVTLTPTVSGSTGTLTFLWGDRQTTPSLALSATTSRTFSVTVKDQNGCAGSATTALTVHTLPTIVLPEQNPACPGVPVALNPTLSPDKAPYSYVWSNGQTSPGITLMPTGPTTVNLRVTDKNGCTQQKTVSVQTVPKPSLEPLPDTVRTCSNTALSLNVSASGGTPSYTFAWSTGETGSAVNRLFTKNERISVRVRDANGCTDSSSTHIVANNPPSFLLPAQLSVCKSGQRTLQAENIAGQAPFSFAWSSGENAARITVTGSGSQTYRLSVTDGNGCRTTGAVVVNATGIEGISLRNDTLLCLGDSLLLLPDVRTGEYSYVWNTGSREPFLRILPLAPSRYEVYVEDAAGCRDTFFTRVAIQAPPRVTLADSFRVCAGDSLLLSPQTTARGLTFRWDDGASTSERRIVVLSSSAYSLTVADAKGCKTTLSTKIQALPLPSVQLPEVLSPCQGSTLSIQPLINAPGGIATVNWSNGAQERTLAFTANDTTLLVCRVRDLAGCSSADSVAVRPLPKPVLQLPEKVSACVGERVRIAPLGAAGDSYTLRWNTGIIAPFIEVLARQSDPYTAIATNTYACTDTATTLLEAHPLPVLSILGEKTYCAASSGLLKAEATSNANPLRYLWSTGSQKTTTTVDTSNNKGMVYLRVTDAKGCVAKDSIRMQALPSPSVTAPENTAVCEEQRSSVAPLVSGGTRPYRYRWSSGDSSAVALLYPGNYTFEVQDANGCQNTLPIRVSSREAPELTVTTLARPTCNKPDGLVEISVRSNAAPVRVQWSNGAVGTRQQNLYPGVYQVAATDSFNCFSELDIQLLCTCTAQTGKMDPRPLSFCKTEQKTALYDATGEVVPAGMKRWFVLHNNAGLTLGNILLAIDSLPILRYVPGMVSGSSYYLSAIISTQDTQGKPNFGDPCLVVSAGTPVTLLATPDKPGQLSVADTAVCPGSTILISTNRQEGGFTYVWKTPLGEFKTGTPGFTLANFSRRDIGAYFVSVENQGCISAPLGPLHLGIAKEVEEVFAEPDKVACGTDSILLQANAPDGAKGKWLSSSPALIANPEQENTLVEALVPQENLFLWTVITRNCVIQDSVVVYYVPKPTLFGDTLLLDDENNTAFFDILRNDNLRDIPREFLNVTLLSKPEKGNLKVDSVGNITYIRDNSIGEDQEYTFAYRVCNTDPKGNCPNRCDDAEVLLRVRYNPRTLAYPAIGLRPGYANPTWQFEAARPMFSARLSILDRWGRVVYQEEYPEIQKGELVKSWNGLRGNTPLPPGAYYFALEGVIENNEKVVQTGILYLLE